MVNKIPKKNRRVKPSKRSEEKWGKEVIKIGFLILPSILLRAQRRLGLSSSQLVVLMHLADFWWVENRKPYPGKQALADRMDLTTRQVQRIVSELETAGYVKRIPRFYDTGGRASNFYDLDGLVKKLKKIAPEFAIAKKRARATIEAVEKPNRKLK